MVKNALVWWGIAASLPCLHAQAPTVIRAEAREVLVDAAVTDKKGVFNGELTAKDFSVWEDGKTQKINSVTSSVSDPETSLKHFVLYFDFRSLAPADQAAIEKYAAGFVDGMASPDRYMAVVSMDASGSHVRQDFTTAKAVLKQAVAVPTNGGARGVQAGAFVFNDSNGLALLTESLSGIAAAMAPATGRKAVILFTGGYGTPDAAPVKALIVACNRANVALYVITSKGTGTFGDTSRGRGGNNGVMQSLDLQPAVTFAQTLADGTGGESFQLSEALPNELAGIAREQDGYYRIAYTPPPAKEGSCHTLRMATSNRSLNVRARNEYCTERQVDLVAGRIAGQALEQHAATTAGAIVASMQAPYFYTGSNRASVHLALDLIPTGMKFDSDKTGLHGQLDFVGTVTRSDGGTAARFADTVNIDLENRQRADEFTRSAYHYEHQFTVAAGSYSFQMALGAGPNAVGKAETPLVIGPWNPATFGIAGIAFSTETHSVDAVPAASGPVLESRAPLRAGGKEFVPASTNRFRNSDRVYFYTEVYEPSLASADGVGLMVQIRVLDQKTGQLKQDSGMVSIAGYLRPGNPSVPFATALQMAQLPPGGYRLEIKAAHPSGPDTVAQSADFEIY